MWTPFGEIPDRIARGLTMAERHDWLRARVSRRSFLKATLDEITLTRTRPA